MADTHGKNNLAIFAYGSLLSDPGAMILPHIVARVRFPSPWPIEYARRAKLRGDGPTLILHDTGGIGDGRLLVLDLQENRLDEFVVDHADFGVEPLNGVSKGGEHPLWSRAGLIPRSRSGCVY